MIETTTHGAPWWGGTVASGFEHVRDAFVAGLDDFGDGGGALAAYVDGKPVVDLWGGSARSDEAWQRDTLSIIWSTTKALATLCVQILFDRGQLDLDAPVARYWPEFAAAGKDRVRVRHILSHTTGVLAPVEMDKILSWSGEGWSDYARIEAGLAAAVPAVPVGSTFAYQAFSFGWLLDALVRRITGDSIGTFFRREIAEPLSLDVWIGTPRTIQPRVATFLAEPPRKLDPEAAALVERNLVVLRDPSTLSGRAFLALRNGYVFDNVPAVNLPSYLEAEVAGANGTATARSLARVFALLAEGGELDGIRVVSQSSIRRFRAVQVIAPNALEMEADPPAHLVQLHTRLLGYHSNSNPFGLPRPFGPTGTAFGHGGAGGQVGFADPETGIAVGFVRSQFTSTPTYSAELIELLYRCAGRG